MDIPKQKWGTFETHAQRAGGKTTEDSMREIDEFVAGGAAAHGASIERVEKTTKLGTDLKGMLNRNGIQGDFIKSYDLQSAGGSSGSGTGGFGGASRTVTETTETHYQMEGERKEGVVRDDSKFKPSAAAPPGGGTADAFLRAHQAKEAAKYKPGYANIRPGGVN